MLFFSEGKGLQTVCNETTVGEQNPLAALVGPSSFFQTTRSAHGPIKEVHLSPT